MSTVGWGVSNMNLFCRYYFCKTNCKSTNAHKKVTSSCKNIQQQQQEQKNKNNQSSYQFVTTTYIKQACFVWHACFFAACCSEHSWCWCCVGSKCDVTMWHRTCDPWGSCIYGAMVQRQCWETSVQVGLHRLPLVW